MGLRSPVKVLGKKLELFVGLIGYRGRYLECRGRRVCQGKTYVLELRDLKRGHSVGMCDMKDQPERQEPNLNTLRG